MIIQTYQSQLVLRTLHAGEAYRAKPNLGLRGQYNALIDMFGLHCECPKGAFYLMAALPVDDADAFQKWLLTDFDDNGDTVMFAPGGPFYATPGKGVNEIRIAYVLKQKDLERAMDLLAKGIVAYNNRAK